MYITHRYIDTEEDCKVHTTVVVVGTLRIFYFYYYCCLLCCLVRTILLLIVVYEYTPLLSLTPLALVEHGTYLLSDVIPIRGTRHIYDIIYQQQLRSERRIS